MIRRTVLFSGRVQGVGFRYTTCGVAEDYAVTGYVRNLTDGRVETVVEGDTSEVERFLTALKAEMASYIRDVQQHDGPAAGEFRRFEVRF
ncbi:MAG TPA: acylphosphatase [Phycisphaerae bacterium]|nr:acylphosphatase [Phycisphaerae bacterium]